MGKIKGKKRKIKKEKIPVVKAKTRKDVRKEKRQMKKLKKKEYFGKGKGADLGRYVRAPTPEVEEELCDEQTDLKVSHNKKKESCKDLIQQENLGAKKREEKLKNEMMEKRNNQLLKENEKEDRIIKKLEKQLKLKKKKSGAVAKSFTEDGLGYLLEVCEEKTLSAAVAAEKHLADAGSGSDFEEDFAIATGKSNVAKCKYSKTPSRGIDSDNSEDIQSDPEHDSDQSDDEYCSAESTMEDSDMEMGEEFEEEEILDDEEMEGVLTHSSICHFPDDTFQPGNLTPVKEETDQELNFYMNNLEIPTTTRKKNTTNDSCDDDEINSDEEHVLELDSDDEKMFQSTSEKTEDSLCSSKDDIDSDAEACNSADMSDYESSDSECNNSECFSDEEDDEKDYIIINGKVVNTYGRQVPDNIEPDFERCPKLDNVLSHLSDSDNESIGKSKPVNALNNTGTVSKRENRKRKKEDGKKLEHPIKKAKVNTKAENEKIGETSNKRKLEKLNEGKKELDKQKKNKMASDSEESCDDSDLSLDSDEEDGLFDDEEDSEADVSKEIGDDETWEDIYGRKRDKSGNVIEEKAGKYIPPHLRSNKSGEDSAEMVQLRRQIKGLLNKVAGSNMHWTGSQIESIYSSNSRYAVNSAFCSLWLSALVQHTFTPDRMAAEHAMLVTVLHANVGSEVGAHFLQTIVKKFDDMLNANQQLENKELDNLVLVISQLYNFKIFQSSLLYEILNKLLEHMSEKSVECTLVALRNVGGTLRKDNPAALKKFIHDTQQRVINLKQETSDGSRVKFLLDILMAIKNNNMNKIPNYDPSYAEDLKKALKGTIRRGNHVVTLNIKLEDLLKADEKGKWWIVGSAWEGSSNREAHEDKKEGKKDKNQAFLMELAKKQRINTEVRRNIFCIIMSAEDYMDCFEKLQQLGLKNQQEKEIVPVLLSCCLQEKVYNPYYALLAQKFCDYDRKFQLSIQFSVWDKIKEIDSCSSFQIANLAQFLTHLFNEKGLPISILKVVQFSDLTKSALRLMRQILLAIILQKNWQTCLEVFQRIAVSPKLHMFREGLRLFISHFLLKNSDKKESILSEEQMTLLKERATAIDKALNSDSKLRF